MITNIAWLTFLEIKYLFGTFISKIVSPNSLIFPHKKCWQRKLIITKTKNWKDLPSECLFIFNKSSNKDLVLAKIGDTTGKRSSVKKSRSQSEKQHPLAFSNRHRNTDTRNTLLCKRNALIILIITGTSLNENKISNGNYFTRKLFH